MTAQAYEEKSAFIKGNDGLDYEIWFSVEVDVYGCPDEPDCGELRFANVNITARETPEIVLDIESFQELYGFLNVNDLKNLEHNLKRDLIEDFFNRK